MYGQLCKRLSEEAPNFEPPDSPCTFRVLLLNKCRTEFENRAATLDQYGHGENTVEEEERRQLAKRKMLGNIKFIGELGKLEILAESILHRCIQELLLRRKGDDPSEDLECLCQILRTCGRILDTNKGKKLMDQYFERMGLLADNPDLTPRIRFMLKDVIDLRHHEWVPRKATIVEGPMPIHQIRPTEDDRQGFRRDRNQDHRGDLDRTSGSELFRHPMKMRSGIDEMLMNINLSTSGTNLIPPFGTNGFGGQRDGGGYRSHNNQRSGYNNYNNQRGQYKHNQNNSNSQYNNQSNKDLAPRFKKNLIVTQNFGDLELRPASYSLSNKPIKTTNNVINTRSIDPTPQPAMPKQPPAPLMKEVSIKQVSTEKPKQPKKDKGPNKEEVLKKYATLIEKYLKSEVTLNEAVESYKENKVPDKFLKEAVANSLQISLGSTEEDCEKLMKFFGELRNNNILINNSIIHDTFKVLCNAIEECENETTKVMSTISVLLSSAVVENVATLADVAAFADNGLHYPLFLLVLQRLHKRKGQADLYEIFTASKINLLSQLPENDRTKERLSEVLEERELTFLYPLLRIQAELSKQLQADPNPQVFYKWIKENLDAVNYTDPGFINALMTVLLKYISQEASMSAEDDKAIADKERSLLERYRPILHAFLQEQPALQLIAVYSLQVHFYALGFPRGQLLRWFMALYDLEIVEEEAFLNWKEDVTDAYPGKGQALFQVNQWLTWLQEAESEEEEEGDE